MRNLARGVLRSRFSYDLAFLHLATENDFGRYRSPGRPLETFYRNAGSSRRCGIESAMGWFPSRDISVRGAYTFSDFQYTNIRSLFGDFSDKVIPTFQWKSGSYRAEILFSIRNLLNLDYIAFTEPDPDGNSSQPGPRREYFVGGRVWLGQ